MNLKISRTAIKRCPHLEEMRELALWLWDRNIQQHAKIERLQAIVTKLPVKKILRACELISNAEANAPPNRRLNQEMTPGDIEDCLGILIDCREAAEAERGSDVD